MKRCPECRRDYYDDTLLYCLDDGNVLLEGPAAMDEPATAFLSEPPALAGGVARSESPTRPQIHSTDQTAIFPTGAEAEPRDSLDELAEMQSRSANRAAKPQGRRNKHLAIFGIATLLLVGGYFGYRYLKPVGGRQINSIAVLPFENRSGTSDTELDPNISYIHLVYSGSYLGPVGKIDEAVTEAERAVELEPLSLIDNAVLASAYIYARQYDKALVQARKAYDLDPNFPLSRHWLGMAYVAKGQYDQAVAIGREASPDSPSWLLPGVVLGHAYAKMGKRADAEKQIAELRELGKSRYVRPYYIASIYAALGDKDSAFGELERSFQERDVYLSRVNNDPFIDPLRDDPRFRALLKRMTSPNNQ